MNRLGLWILGAAAASFAAGVNVGLVAPDLLAAEAESTPDDEVVRALVADYGLTHQQEWSLRQAMRIWREEEVALISTIEPSRLPLPVQQKLRAIRRQLRERILAILDEDQRARYERASRVDSER